MLGLRDEMQGFEVHIFNDLEMTLKMTKKGTTMSSMQLTRITYASYVLYHSKFNLLLGTIFIGDLHRQSFYLRFLLQTSVVYHPLGGTLYNKEPFYW